MEYLKYQPEEEPEIEIIPEKEGVEEDLEDYDYYEEGEE